MAQRRGKRSPADEAGSLDDAPTLGETLERLGLLGVVGPGTRAVMAACNAAAADQARTHLRVIACFDCTAPKACCSLVAGAYLHEGAAVAARLIDEGRDTPALRRALADAADAMERSDTVSYRRPCVLLGAGERCTVYEDRPSICGAHLVTSPAPACSDPEIVTESALAGTHHVDGPRALAEQFRASLGLPALDVPYRGALPRMVLLCLEAWDHRAYAAYFAEHLGPAVQRYRWAIR